MKSVQSITLKTPFGRGLADFAKGSLRSEQQLTLNVYSERLEVGLRRHEEVLTYVSKHQSCSINTKSAKMMEAEASNLHLTFKKIIECSDEIKVCCSESAGCSPKEQQQKSIECRSRIADLLTRQLQLSLKALSCVTVRKSLSQTIRMKCHDEKSGETIGSRGLSEILQLIDDYAETLPLYVDFLNGNRRQSERRATKRRFSALYPPLVGSIPQPDTDALPVGNLVVVWKKDEDQNESKWVLAEVLDRPSRGRGVRGRGHYTLLENLAEFEYYRDHFTLSHTLPFLLKNIPRHDIIPLPCFRADPRHHSSALFGPGSIVMARFPKTSVFYRACVLAPPESLRDGYRVTFDMKFDFNFDGNTNSRDGAVQSYVIPQLFVVQNPPGNRRSRMPHE